MMFWFNRHRRLRDQLSAYIDGELDASAAERLERHLAECGRCRQEMEQLRATVAALQELPAVEPPRSFTLSPERVAPRPPLPAASPLAFGTRIAAAGVAAALAIVLVVDLGDFGGDGVTDEAAAPQMMRSEADGEELEAAGGAAATDEGVPAPAEPGASEPENDLMSDLGEPATRAGDDTDAGLMPDAEIAVTPAAAPEEAEAPAVTPASGGGGVDALTAVEIGLAAVLGLLVAGSLALAFAGRRR